MSENPFAPFLWFDILPNGKQLALLQQLHALHDTLHATVFSIERKCVKFTIAQIPVFMASEYNYER